MDSISDSEERKPPKQLTDARHEFNEYLVLTQVPGHYLSVSSRGAPLRRVDGDKVTALAQLAIIRDRFKWDDAQSRWIRSDGGMIVTEDQIYDVIMSFQRRYDGTREDFHNTICANVDGVHTRDVREAIGLWKKHKLGSLDVSDDTLWGGPAVVYEPRSISVSVDSDHSEDQIYSTPGTDLPSRTRTRNHAFRAPPMPEEAAIGAFHPDHPDWLHIGTSKEDETDIWLSLVLRSGSQEGQLHPFFHDSSAKAVYETAVNIKWHKEFEYSNFPGTESEQKRAQRSYLWGIIQDHRGDLVPAPRSRGRISVSGKHPSDPASRLRIPATQDLLERTPLTGQSRARQSSDKTELEHAQRLTIAALTPTSLPVVTKKRRRQTNAIESGPSGQEERQHSPRPTKRTTLGGASLINSGSLNSIPSQMGAPNLPRMEARYGHDPQSNPFEGLSSNAIAGTSLLVSADNQQPGRAPANVPLDDCGTQEQLFETLVIECNLKGKAAAELSAVSATYKWNHKQHLIRKGRPRDWSIFCEDIRKAWEREAGRFAEDGCEIRMMVHVDA